jgi:hypothetical protein
MTRESFFYKILSGVHIVFFTSLLCGLTMLMSGTLLMLPVLSAAFFIGKDVIYRKININDSIVMTYFKYLKESLPLMKFIPINLIMLLNAAGMFMAVKANNTIYSVVCLAFISFLIVFMLYIAGYYVFVNKNFNALEAAVCMLLKPQFLIPVFAVMVVNSVFVSVTLLIILLFTGTFFLFALEVIVFIHILYFKKLTGNLGEEDDFAYLVNRERKKK